MGESYYVLPPTVLPVLVPSRPCLEPPRTNTASSPPAPLPPWRYMASLELGAGLAFRLNGTAEELQ